MSETEVEKKPAKKKEPTPQEKAAAKVSKAFEKVKVIITPRYKHDQRRAVMNEPVPFDPKDLTLEQIDKRWFSMRKTYHYPIETEVEITRYALEQFRKSYTGVKRNTEVDQEKGENAADLCKKVKRYIIEVVS